MVRIEDKSIATFAGIFDTWMEKETGEALESFAIVTTEASDLVVPIHDRMPVYLHPEKYDEMNG